jgi:hypothetical protein
MVELFLCLLVKWLKEVSIGDVLWILGYLNYVFYQYEFSGGLILLCKDFFFPEDSS